MYFLEHHKGLFNKWKRIAFSEGRKSLQELIDSVPAMNRNNYRITEGEQQNEQR